MRGDTSELEKRGVIDSPRVLIINFPGMGSQLMHFTVYDTSTNVRTLAGNIGLLSTCLKPSQRSSHTFPGFFSRLI